MTSYTQPSKTSSAYTQPSLPVTDSYLLRENGDFLLREQGDQIIIGVTVIGSAYTKPSKNSASYTQPSRN